MPALGDYIAVAEDIIGRFRVTYGAVLGQLQTATATEQDVRFLATELREQREEVRQLRLSFDEVNVLVFEGAEDPIRRLELWEFEKAFRASLVDVSTAMQSVIAQAEAFLGDEDFVQLVLGREGETLQSIAQRELGDWRAWVQLQIANATEVDPGENPAGKLLVVPRVQ